VKATRAEIETGVREIAIVHLGLTGAVGEEARLIEDLGLDSLQIVTLAFEIENRFEIILEPEDERAIVTVGDLVDTIERLVSASEQSAKP
jgi:acyl carrier protein